ncbi:hypothetical protein EKG37_02300 [Robertmurraya yapensis]|uniref:Polysaccharide chain length determinant N-terminal domain-containing protein n=1 Tax=Bacillus yapensis TaxID=2492960 RepID=A0A3S0KRX7_9BACI|nr:hypothetical protein [Bacillus yapensis]RTR36407.1 hypothetical protein EKG37_02300 [Bacillus yapensis]TKT05911.1 hypothetical protein FAR12_02300 [Bacillus yapensis]
MEANQFLNDIFTTLKKYIWLVLLLSVAGGFVGKLINAEGPPPTYKNATSILIEKQYEQSDIRIFQSDETSRFLSTAQILIETPPILERVKENLGLKKGVREIETQISTEILGNSNIIRIEVEAGHAEEATDIANATADAFASEVGTILDVKRVTILETAVKGLENKIEYNRTNATIFMGVIIGFVIGIFLAFLIGATTKRSKKSQTNA